jgi:hypothetical protein
LTSTLFFCCHVKGYFEFIHGKDFANRG